MVRGPLKLCGIWDGEKVGGWLGIFGYWVRVRVRGIHTPHGDVLVIWS